MHKKLLFAAIITLSLHACYHDNEEELYPVAAGCNTTTVTYSGVTQKIISTRCAISGCHVGPSGSAGGNFDTHAGIKSYLDTKKSLFINSIKHTSGASPMPKVGGKLSDCEIQQIEIWINAGYPNN